MQTRFFVLVMVLGLIGTACGDAAGPTVGPGGPDPLATDASVAHAAVFADDLVVVPAADADEALSVLSARLLTEEDIQQRAGVEDSGDAAATLLEELAYVTSEDPVMDANTLRSQGIDARPAYTFALTGHWSFEPGGDPPMNIANPAMFEQISMQINGGNGEGRLVAIVDSGFPAVGIAALDDVGLTAFDQADPGTSSSGHSHGLFVASIVKQISPDSPVIGARVAFMQTNSRWPDGDEFAHPRRVDEVSVAIAILRLRAAAGSRDVVLNMSLGTYAHPLANGGHAPPLSLERLLETWRAELAQAEYELTVVAAGGNELLTADTDTAFYPAAFGGVIGVGALDAAGTRMVWDGGQPQPVPLPDYSWIAETARGFDLVGVAEGQTLTRWDGSSFATAVVSGSRAAGTTPILCPANLVVDVAGAVASCP